MCWLPQFPEASHYNSGAYGIMRFAAILRRPQLITPCMENILKFYQTQFYGRFF